MGRYSALMRLSQMDKIFEKLFGKRPGLDVVVLVITWFTVPRVLPKETVDEWSLLIDSGVWLVALLLWGASGKWDDWLFDPLYGSEPVSVLDQSAFGICVR